MEASSTEVLGQFLLISLLVERIIAVVTKVFERKAKQLAEDASSPQDPPLDPWQNWSRLQVLSAFALALCICYGYSLDLFSKAIHGTLPSGFGFIGYLLSAIVISGGSAGIQKILAAVSATAKAAKAEAKARIAEARVRPLASSQR